MDPTKTTSVDPHANNRPRSTPGSALDQGMNEHDESASVGGPPVPLCPRCDRRVDQSTIGPLVGLGHCPSCAAYSCRWCWVEALSECPSCHAAFATGTDRATSASIQTTPDAADGPSDPGSSISLGRRFSFAFALFTLLVLIASWFIRPEAIESAIMTVKSAIVTAPSDPTHPMWVGVESTSNDSAAGIKGAVDFVRLDTPSSSTIARYHSAGLAVLDVMSGPYDTGGVMAIDATTFASDAVATFRTNPSIVAIEILNEPGGSWFWGPDALTQSNAQAYALLLKTVHEAFVGAFGEHRPLLLASYDGGNATSDAWGKAVWTADPEVGSYIDGITMHPYGGLGDISASALGNRASVVAARLATGLPVYVTEVGWPTAVGQPATSDSLQWSEADQSRNIYDFVEWARSTRYIGAVIVFKYQDSDANMAYGITRLDGSPKKSFEDLRRVATGMPRSP